MSGDKRTRTWGWTLRINHSLNTGKTGEWLVSSVWTNHSWRLLTTCQRSADDADICGTCLCLCCGHFINMWSQTLPLKSLRSCVWGTFVSRYKVLFERWPHIVSSWSSWSLSFKLWFLWSFCLKSKSFGLLWIKEPLKIQWFLFSFCFFYKQFQLQLGPKSFLC